MNQNLVLAVIGVIVAAFLIWPFLRRTGSASPRATARRELPVERSGETADELSELELDREMGRISEADYERWRARIEGAAVPDQVPAAVVAEPARPDPASRAEALVRRWREAPRPRCATCGERPEPAARYCSNCGAALGG